MISNLRKIFLVGILLLCSSSSQAGFFQRLWQAPPPICRYSNSVTIKLKDISCIAEKAKYKCTPLGKTLRGVGTYYGKGDKFTGGKTLCEKPFKPTQDKILAIQDSLIPVDVFRRGFCGRRAIVVAYDQDDGRCRVASVELSDTGNMGAKDSDHNNSTRDKIKVDHVNLMGRRIDSPRVFDLSYAAAKDLGYAEGGAEEDGKAWMEVQICEELAPGAHPPSRK